MNSAVMNLVKRTMRGVCTTNGDTENNEVTGVQVWREDYFTMRVLEVNKSDGEIKPAQGYEYTLTFSPSDFTSTGCDLDQKEEYLGYFHYDKH